jgi:hypothetical protein
MAINWSDYEKAKLFSTKNFEGSADFTIACVTVEPVGQEKEMKPVVRVHEDPKGLVLNVTRAKALRKAYGDDEQHWIGKHFRLLKAPGFFGGDACDMLVVQAPVPPPRRRPIQAAHPERGPQPPSVDDEVPPADHPDWADLND